MATPYMSLSLPTVSSSSGPGWATSLNTALTTIDSHTHIAGQGQQVPTAGLNINADLPLNGFNLTLVRSARYSSQGSPLSLPTDANCVYVSGGNLYYNNGSGQAVQITSGTSLSATSAGGIGGLAATTGSATYNSGAGTFTWWSNTNVAATMDHGPLIIRDVAASALGITVKSPVSLAGAYNLVLPTALPGSTKILQLTSAGQINAALDVDGATLTIAANVLAVPALGIGTSQLAANAVTRAKLAAVGQQLSSSCGSFSNSGSSEVDVTNLTITITTTGRPVVLMLVSDGSGISSLNPGTNVGTLYIDRGGSNIAQWAHYTANPVGNGGIFYADPVAAGTYTYKIRLNPGGTASSVNNYKLLAYEL